VRYFRRSSSSEPSKTEIACRGEARLLRADREEAIKRRDIMRKFSKVSIIALVALSIWACADNANKTPAANAGNTNANSNATASKAAPNKDALFEMDKKANEAYTKGDSKFFEGLLADKFVMYDMGKRFDKAATLKMIGDAKCDVKSMSLDEPQMGTIDADTAVITYKATFDGTCNGPDGKPMKVPSPVRSASVYVRNGDKWMAVYHGETPIVDPKNPPKMPPPPPPAKMDEKKESNSAESKPAADPNTDAMLAVEKAGWEAWKERDAKKLGDLVTNNLSFVDLFGNYTATKDDTIKSWTAGKCEIKSTNLTDATGESLSPTLGVLMFKGSADGTCDGQKIMPLYGTSFYVKEGDSWKLAFGFESPA
jgi:Domain of unknown function (DUF4440)